MWTKENRARYDRSKRRSSKGLTDAEWALVEPLIPLAKRGGDKRAGNVREAVNGLLGALYRLSVAGDPEGSTAALEGAWLF